MCLELEGFLPSSLFPKRWMIGSETDVISHMQRWLCDQTIYIWQPGFQPRATTILTLIPKIALFERKYLFKASFLVCMLNFQAVYVWSVNIYDLSFSIFQNHPNRFRTAMTSPIRQRHSAHLKTEPTLAKSVEAPLVTFFSCWVNSDRMKHAEFIHIKQNP